MCTRWVMLLVMLTAPAVAEAPQQVCRDDGSSLRLSQRWMGRENRVVCRPTSGDLRERRRPQPPIESISDNMWILGVLPPPGNGQVNDVWSPRSDLVIMGKFLDGWSVVDVSNPFLPTEIASTGAGLFIKDAKSEGDVVVVNNERDSIGAGAVLYDITNPLAPVELARITSPLALSVHNVFLEDGFLYLSSNTSGRVEIFDARVPSNPVHVASVADDNGRIHDAAVINGRLYSSFLDGGFRVHDVSDPTAPVLLASQDYEGAVTHNAWPSADGRFLFTTDEVAGGHLRVWDLGEVGGGQGPVRQIGRFVASQPAIIHNVFVKDELVYASYYTAGLRIIDVSTPRLPVEVAIVDTFPGGGNVFDGVWGVFPADEGGIVYLTDVVTGLWVLRFDGRIADAPTGLTGSAVLERSALFARNVYELSWSPHPQAVGYNIYRAQPDQPFTRVADSPQLSTRFLESGPAEAREYAVTAVLVDRTESRPTPILRLEASR